MGANGRLEIGTPVEIRRGGDPAIPTTFDGLQGNVIGHSTMSLDGAIVPTVGVRYRRPDGSYTQAWIVRWHVHQRPETFRDKLRRRTRAWLKEVLAE
jgi:hypothetical protein